MHVSPPSSAAVDSVLQALMSAGRLIRQRVAGEVDPGTFWLLKIIADHASLRVSDLASCASLDASTVSRHVGQLERNGLIERGQDPADRRAQLLSLTPEGQRQLGEAYEQRRELLRRSLAAFDETELAEFDRLLARFVTALENAEPAQETR